MQTTAHDVYARAISAARAERALATDPAIQAALSACDTSGPALLRRRCVNAATLASAVLDLDARLRAGLAAPAPWLPARPDHDDHDFPRLIGALTRLAARLRAHAHAAEAHAAAHNVASQRRADYSHEITTMASELLGYARALRSVPDEFGIPPLTPPQGRLVSWGLPPEPVTNIVVAPAGHDPMNVTWRRQAPPADPDSEPPPERWLVTYDGVGPRGELDTWTEVLLASDGAVHILDDAGTPVERLSCTLPPEPAPGTVVTNLSGTIGYRSTPGRPGAVWRETDPIPYPTDDTTETPPYSWWDLLVRHHGTVRVLDT